LIDWRETLIHLLSYFDELTKNNSHNIVLEIVSRIISKFIVEFQPYINTHDYLGMYLSPSYNPSLSTAEEIQKVKEYLISSNNLIIDETNKQDLLREFNSWIESYSYREKKESNYMDFWKENRFTYLKKMALYMGGVGVNTGYIERSFSILSRLHQSFEQLKTNIKGDMLQTYLLMKEIDKIEYFDEFNYFNTIDEIDKIYLKTKI
jgi:hypothetical protein